MNTINKNSIGVLGGGFVGQILKRYYPDAKVYDINGKFDSLEETLRNEIIFIAFNLLDNAQDLQPIDDYLRWYGEGINRIKPPKVIIIKSTFVPGTLDKLQNKYPYLNIVYNCEFLTEMTAWEDFTKPQFQILGVPHQSLPLVHELFALLPDAPIKRVISPIDAEMLKHSFNSYFALKVSWFNQLYDACKGLGADYETVKEIMTKNSWVGDSHSVIFHKGYRGYGGKCLSKDPKNLAKVVNFPIINHIEEYNEKLKTK